MPIDLDRLSKFRRRSRSREDVGRIFERAGFQVCWIVEDSEDATVWGYHLKLNPPLQRLFGTAREVLVWVAEYRDYRAKTVMQAQRLLAKARPRLCEDFAFIITNDPDTLPKVDETAQALLTAFVGYSLDDFRRTESLSPGDFVREIQTRLFTKDLYFLSTAITSPHAFFGRKQLVADICAALLEGSRHVGLFGLRKMGKTSVLFRLSEILRAREAVLSAHLDIQRIDAINPTAEYFLWSLGEQLFDSNSEARRITGYKMFGTRNTFLELKLPGAVFELFDHDFRLLLSRTEGPLVVLLDEIELMSQKRWADSFVRVWRLLRAIDQEFGGRTSYFVTGTNPKCIEANRVNDADNPVYNYFDVRFLGPLTPEESKDLLVRLGRPMGITWMDSAVARLSSATGGHPFLLRAFASFLHRATLPRRTEVAMSPERASAAIEPFLSRMNSTLSQMIEVIREQYESEFFLLERLAEGRLGEFREMARTFPADVAHLEGYGLIRDPIGASGLAVELLQTWLQRRGRARVETPAPGRHGRRAPNEEYEGYVIEASVGHEGGFGAVYKARRGGTESYGPIALKILAEGSFVALQREVTALQSATHSNIVQVLDHGQATDGSLYVVMEYLDGRSLRYYCQRATRLRSEEAHEAMKQLSEALMALHPNQERVETLRKMETLSESEFAQLEEARYGYVHRDIKPENIIVVPQRGPVLIDFGLCVKVAEPIRTQSCTPGYLPPDGVPGRWDVDVDLYQLGLTMTQAVVGVEYDGDNLQDLRQLIREEVPEPVSGVLTRLTEANREDRPRSAVEVRKALAG